MWNICTHETEPTILLPLNAPVPEGYSIEGQTSNPNFLTESVPDYGRKITVLAFRNRFTQAEKVRQELACLDNVNASMESRQLAAALRVATKDSDVASYIDLDRADTRAGVIALETYGILGAGRALQILDNPVQAHEVPLSMN